MFEIFINAFWKGANGCQRFSTAFIRILRKYFWIRSSNKVRIKDKRMFKYEFWA